MALKASKEGKGKGNFIPQANIAPGTYPARIVQILDLGLQAQRPYKGEDKAPAHEISLTYELVDEFMVGEDGNPIEDKPRWISETLPFYGLFADKAKSTQRYNALDPEGKHDGDFAQLIGTACNVTIVNNKSGDKIYDNVATISTMRQRDADKCPDLVNAPKVFDLDAPDLEIFNALPEWLRDKIKGNLKFKGSALEQLLDGGGDRPRADKKAAARAVAKAVEEEQDDDAPF